MSNEYDHSKPTCVVEFGDKDYRAAARTVLDAAESSFKLRKRVIEDDTRDELEALNDSEVLHALQSKRFAEAAPRGVLAGSTGGDLLEERGVAALQRLYKVACGDSGQCRFIARFLLGLYNGTRFPFDLTNFRAIDDGLFDDCMRVLQMDARVTRREVHTYFENGSKKWEALADSWRVLDVFELRNLAREFAERVGFSGPQGDAAANLLEVIKEKHL
jgi:hypothetical protein